MPGTQRVFLGNIPFDSRTRDVEKFFRGYGKLGEISIKNGYGFVDFEDYRDAEDAVADLNGKDMNGDRVRVELAHDRREKERARRNRRSPRRFDDRGRRRGNPPGRRTDHRIIVENISSRTSWQDLKDFFRTAGDISYTSAHKIRNGEGLVEFNDRRGMEYAIEKLDGTELDGRKIRLIEEKKRSRSRSASRSRSRSLRRSSSPRRRSRSPQRRSSRSPQRRSRSPQRRSKSPDGRVSRSPVRRSETPKSSRSRSRSRSGDRR